MNTTGSHVNMFYSALKELEQKKPPILIGKTTTYYPAKGLNKFLRSPMPLPKGVLKALGVVNRRIKRIGFRSALKTVLRNRDINSISKNELAIVYISFFKNLIDPRIITVIFDKNIGIKTLPSKYNVIEKFITLTKTFNKKDKMHQKKSLVKFLVKNFNRKQLYRAIPFYVSNVLKNKNLLKNNGITKHSSPKGGRTKSNITKNKSRK